MTMTMGMTMTMTMDITHHHHHGDVDPHAWMNPQNAAVWLEAIADRRWPSWIPRMPTPTATMQRPGLSGCGA
jgi:ABC-type Zn2+ transport system substrate-binding protein/surface adhesin